MTLALSLLLIVSALAASQLWLLARYRRLRRHVCRVVRHHHALARLRQSARAKRLDATEQYWAQVRTTAAPVLVTSPDGAILAASSSVVEMFGFSGEQDLRQRSIVELYANPLDRLQLSARLTQHGYLRSGQFRMKHQQGHYFYVLATVRVENVADGSLCYESVLTDISELREAAEDRQRLATQLHLARKLELVGQLASGIAHEINTPMQFVGDNINFLKRAFERMRSVPAARSDGVLYSDVDSAFEGTLEGIARVSETVKAMKEFAHPGDVEFASTDLNQALRTTLVVARNEYKHAAEVQLELQDLPPIDCRRAEINKVFLNLIVNAAHAIEARGAGALGLITIRSVNARDAVRVEIADNGCGIPPAVLPRIFDPFFTTKAIGKGSGQGLAIARTIVKDHGGELGVVSTVGEGTTFTITLPRIASREPEFIQAPAPAPDQRASIG